MEPSRARGWHTVLLALATIVTFLPGLWAPFLWDDHQLIEHNTFLRDRAHLLTALTHHFWDVPSIAGTGMHPNRYYRPIVTLAYALQWRLTHGSPAGFHAVNIALHLACVLLVARWLRRRVGGPHADLAAFFGALVFALHPCRPESVTWIAGCTDVWMSLGLLTALTAWDHRRDALAIAALIVAMFAKETVVVAPVLLALDAVLLQPTLAGRRGELVRVARVALALGIAMVIRLCIVPVGTSHLHTDGMIPRVVATLGWYVRMLVWRWPASFQFGLVWYDAQLHLLVAHWAAGVGALTAVTVACLAWAAVHRPAVRPWMADLAWCLVPIVPVLNLVDVRMRMLGETHNLYLPVLGLAAIVARAVPSMASQGRAQRLALLAGPLLFLSAATACGVRELDLLRETDVFSTELAAEPRNPEAQLHVITDNLNAGRFAEARALALSAYRDAVRGHIDEVIEFPTCVAEAQMNLCSDAEQACLAAVRDFMRTLPDPCIPARLGMGALSLNVAAGQPWRREVRSMRRARIVQAVAEARTGTLANAEATLRPVAVDVPDAVPVWGTLALVLARQEKWTEARVALSHAAALSPGDAQIASESSRIDRAMLLSHASATAPDPIAAGAFRAQMFVSLGAPVLAREVVAATVTAHPGHPEIALLSAQVDTSDRRFDLARADLLAARASDPTNAARWDDALRQLAVAERAHASP